jgi:Uma2 family endonuclease
VVSVEQYMQTILPTDAWVTASWHEFMEVAARPALAKAKGYYYSGKMLIETMGTGYDHSCDNGIIYFAVNLYCMVKGIPANGLIGCSFRKAGWWECQPDIAYYIGDRAQSIPRGTKIVDLNQYSPPDLAIEVSDTTLSDDLGNKRLLYEEVSVREYWVIDVASATVKAFAISGGGSHRLSESLVFPGLKISLLGTALQRSRETVQSEVGTWLMQEFQAINI